MATPKIKIDSEKLKSINRLAEKFIMDPHGRSTPRRMSDRFEYDQEYHIHESPPLNVSSTTVNHCQLGGSGDMSGCYACHYSDDKSKIQCQRACDFFIKSSSHERCMWETYGEFCWSTKAQDDKKSKGF